MEQDAKVSSQTERRKAAQFKAAAKRIGDLRLRLLDLSNANRMLSFKHSDRSRTHVRLVDERPNVLMGKLVEDGTLAFRALPEPEDNPRDEQTERFLASLARARQADESYLSTMKELEDNKLKARRVREIERQLKDRLREQLGMPVRPSPQCMSVADYACLHGLDPNYSVPMGEKGSEHKRHLDNEIQTLLLPEEMERKLSALMDRTRTIIQETGVNTLYCALGFLEWYESADSDQAKYAPLLLHPLEMKRRLVRSRYKYEISSTSEETQINITLAARLNRDFGLKLPDLVEDDLPEDYFQKVTAAIKSHKRWSVCRYLTVGHFAFARLVMYNDLDPRMWPSKDGLSAHSVISELLGGTEEEGAYYAEEYDVDEPAITKMAPLLITEADASQFSAIVDVMSGKNLVIKGPPGTGKSQTITNIIAAALAANKTVLFVAEKMAALNVVKKRLDDAGIGEFCLELHSTRARKKDVLDSFGRRLDIQERKRPPRLLEASLRELERLKAQLSHYARLINQPFGELGKTIHDIFWAEQRTRCRRGLPSRIGRIEMARAKTKTLFDVEQDKDALKELAEFSLQICEAHESVEQHPWRGVANSHLNLFEQEQLVDSVQEWVRDLGLVGDVLKKIEKVIGGSLDFSMRTLREFIDRVGQLPIEEATLDGELFERLNGGASSVEATRKFLDDWSASQKITEGLEELCSDIERLVQNAGGIDQSYEDAEALGLLDRRINEIGNVLEAYRRQAESGDRITRFCQRLGNLFGCDGLETFGNYWKLLDAVSFLKDVERGVLRLRSDGLIDEENRKVVEDAAVQCRGLKEDLGTLQRSMRFSISDPSAPTQFRQYAGILRAAGRFWFLKREVLNARREYRRICVRPEKGSNSDLADRFEEVAMCIERVHAFTKDSRLHNVCGSHFRGLESNFEALTQVVQYAAAVRKTFSGTEETEQRIRQCLLGMKVEILDEVRSLCEDQAVNDVRGVAESISGWQQVKADNYSAILKDRVCRLEVLQKRLSGLQLESATELGSLAELGRNVGELTRLRGLIEGNRPAKAVLGAAVEDMRNSFSMIARAVEISTLVRKLGLEEKLQSYLFSRDYRTRTKELRGLAVELGRHMDSMLASRLKSLKLAGLDENAYFGGTFDAAGIDQVATRVAYSAENSDALVSWLNYVKAREQVEERGLEQLVDIFGTSPSDTQCLVAGYERVLYRTLCKEAMLEHPTLAKFRGISQEQARRRFQELDKDILGFSRKQIVADLAHRHIAQGIGYGPRKDYTERALIEHERSKQKRHISIRELLSRASTAAPQLKPCFMMSPVSVAQFLKPGTFEFDLLVVDEASQMRPEDSLCAIARAKQFVVVGDPQQLPPTTFFDSMDIPLDEDDDEELVDNESILDLAMGVFRPWRELRWHYRSRHGSLIAFSNKRFYDNTLIVFPAALHTDDSLGVSTVYVGGTYKGGRAGGTRVAPKRGINEAEAEKIVEAVREFMCTRQHKNLGVVTMNQGQRDLLREMLDQLSAADGRVREYIERWENTLDPFFVKNLELVQGDERDVIFISTVYGPDETKRVMQRFGPINSDVGHRRLNVLFTRAKDQVKVFTSMHPNDVRIDENVSEGVRALRGYLEYAETGRLESGEITGREPSNDFEMVVMQWLKELGHDIVPQVGVAGYFIDLAIRDPEKPGSFLLGIECDGATYHSSKSARDRDRLRQEILEAKGWKLYRIWSTDWFNEPDQELKKLATHIRGLKV